MVGQLWVIVHQAAKGIPLKQKLKQNIIHATFIGKYKQNNKENNVQNNDGGSKARMYCAI